MWMLAASVLVLCYIYYRIRYRRWFELAAAVPNWKRPLPIIGNLIDIIGDGHRMIQVLLEMSEEAEKCNSAVTAWFGPCLVYYISKPEDIKIVSSAYAGKPFFYDLAKPWVAEGLVTASVPVWKRHIKKLAPTFSPTVVDGFIGVFNAQMSLLVDKLRGEVGMGPFLPFRKYLAPATLETVCQTAFGIVDMSQSIVTAEYMQAFNDVMMLTMTRGMNLVMHSDLIYSLTDNCRKYRRSLQILHNVSSTVIKKKREAMKSKANGYVNETGPKNFKAFLDLLLELPEEEAFTDLELRSEVDTMIVGGQETTASTLTMVLLNVGSHPHVQEKVYAELKEIFGDSNRPVDKEDFRRMVYAEAVIKETLRLYPPTPAVMRQADHELKLDGYTIPSGTTCALSLWGAGRWKRSWGEDANLFRPERWMDQDFMPQHAAYVPFSYGKRACIGRLYAVMVLKTALAHILRSYRLKADVSKLRFKLDLVLRPTDGHQLELQLR